MARSRRPWKLPGPTVGDHLAPAEPSPRPRQVGGRHHRSQRGRKVLSSFCRFHQPNGSYRHESVQSFKAHLSAAVLDTYCPCGIHTIDERRCSSQLYAQSGPSTHIIRSLGPTTQKNVGPQSLWDRVASAVR